jgi:hypothetical protein
MFPGGKIILEVEMHLHSKAELIESTHIERGKLETKIAGLTDDEMVSANTMGKWSVKDILQHLVDWEQRWIAWYVAGKIGDPVVTPEAGFNWRQMGKLNELYRQKNEERPLVDVLSDFHTSYKQILDVIEEIPEPEMLAIGMYAWTGKLPLIAWIAGNTCEHYQWALQMIHPISIRRKMRAMINQ